MQPSVSSAGTGPARSAQGRLWQLALDAAQHRQAAALAQQSGLPLVIAQLLVGRGHTRLEAIETFLNPRLEHLPDPAELKDCTRAAGLLADAVIARRVIAIFGDYDVDGTCATALMVHALRHLGLEPQVYIPDRLTEGYGPTVAAMESIAAAGATLLVTVDTGTTAHLPLARAHQLGLGVIVTDHHQPASPQPAHLPLYGEKNAALVNPHRPDDTSGLTMLCGSGVVFFLLIALNRELRQRGHFAPGQAGGCTELKLTQLLDLVALATVADVMPLTGLNRLLVSKGLQQLGTWRHRGLAALAALAGAAGSKGTGPSGKPAAPDAGTLGFQLAPRLNAAGRVDSARLAVELLLCATDDTCAQRLAAALEDKNQQRRGLEQQVLAEAIAQAEALPLEDEPVLVLHGHGWHPGVVGIVAARLKEKFNRPAFVLGHDGTHLKGSARGVAGLDLGAAVRACHHLLVSGGGHAMAAGLSLAPAHLPAFQRALKTEIWRQINANAAFAAHLPLSQRLQAAVQLDAVLSPAGATPELAATLQQLAPYGHGHPEPLLALTGCIVGWCRGVGSTGEHLKLSLTDATGARLEAIAFGCAGTPLGQLLSQSAGRPLALSGHLRSRQFNGRTYLDFQIRDAHASWSPGPASQAGLAA